jgi:hypothetical protein
MNKKLHDTQYIRRVIDYILSHEADDYELHCQENDVNPNDYANNNHIYAIAKIADLDLDIIEERAAFGEEK